MCDKAKTEDDMICHNRIRWTICTAVAALLIFFSSITQVGNFSSMKNEAENLLKTNDRKYVIVFDAGSTGTRMHIFFFLNDSNEHVTLDNEYFQEVKPGLSSFAENPLNAAKSIVPLLEKAKTLVPKCKWNETPIALKATAGLRLLPAHASDSILNEVTDMILSSPFVSSNESVSIMDGEDEGLFAWFTINFLLGNIENPSSSVATLDLGGGSTQVTFAPFRMDTVVLSPEGYVIRRKIQDKATTIYSHSYLGLGLMAARLAILKLDNIAQSEGNILRSVCIHPQTEVLWTHGNEAFMVRGKKGGNYGFDQCYGKAVTFLNSTIDNPEELWMREVYGVSYYFDRALDLGIIGEDGGIVTVGEYMQAANKACSNWKKEEPFLCLDVSYITALFHHGLEFSKKTEIKLVKQIKGIETSWGLGAAFNMLR